MVMGGRNSEGFALFTNLTIKAFLAVRPHAEQIIDTIQLMLGSGLPSFKGEPTIHRLRDRFALHLNERGAADWMASIVRNAYENMRSTLYDEFQRVCTHFPKSGFRLTLHCLKATEWYDLTLFHLAVSTRV